MTESVLGIEVLGQDLKIALLGKSGKSLKVLSLDKIAAVQLGDWVKEHCPRTNQISAFLTLPESLVYFKKLSLPKASSAQVQTALDWEIRANAPIPVDQAVFDSHLLETKKNTADILVMFVKSDTVENLLELFQGQNIQVKAIEPASLALSRLISINPKLNTLLLTVENEETNLLVLEKGYPTFTTSVSAQITPDNLNRRRLSGDLITDLAKNTQNTLEYWQSRENSRIDQFVISGDISKKYYGLATALYKLTQIPAFSAKQKLKLPLNKQIPKAYIPRFYTSIGAALKIRETVISPNFLPPKEKAKLLKVKKQQHILKLLTLGLFTGFVILFVALGILFFKHYQSDELARKINQTDQFTANHPAQTYLPQARKLEFVINTVDTLIQSQKNIGTKLAAVGQIKPSAITLKGISFQSLKDDEYTVSGIGDRLDILAFYDNAIASLSAQSVTMPYSNLQAPKDNPFELLISWP